MVAFGEKKEISLLRINLYILFMSVLVLCLGSFFQIKDLKSGLLITQYALILMPSILYIKFKNYRLGEVVHLRKLRFKELFYTVIIILAAYPIAVVLNGLLSLFIKSLGALSESNQEAFLSFMSENSMGKLIFIVCITPGLCEEFLFRGLIYKTYESKYGRDRTIVLTAILFGLFHFNIYNLAGPIFLGLVLGKIRDKSDSILPSMLGHSLNNLIGISLGYFSAAIPLEGEVDMLDSIVMQESLIGILLLVFVVLLCFLVLKLALSRYPSRRREVEISEEEISIVDILPILAMIMVYILLLIKLYFKIF